MVDLLEMWIFGHFPITFHCVHVLIQFSGLINFFAELLIPNSKFIYNYKFLSYLGFNINYLGQKLFIRFCIKKFLQIV